MIQIFQNFSVLSLSNTSCFQSYLKTPKTSAQLILKKRQIHTMLLYTRRAVHPTALWWVVNSNSFFFFRNSFCKILFRKLLNFTLPRWVPATAPSAPCFRKTLPATPSLLQTFTCMQSWWKYYQHQDTPFLTFHSLLLETWPEDGIILFIFWC